LDPSNTRADIQIIQAIRTSIMKQKLSTNAKNIKVITQSGVVTLRGLSTVAQNWKPSPGLRKLRRV
jgi:osmotically-inducible protein OsmY